MHFISGNQLHGVECIDINDCDKHAAAAAQGNSKLL
jgi:hypothetical protein